MNAVKRCLALIAATLVVGACSGDPTADEAGANLTIRATPGAVWVRRDLTAAVLLEAIDGTGATQPGTWTAGSLVGPVVATRDTSYLPNYTGTAANAQQWIISSTAEGEGSVTFTGTGGSVTIPIRIAPALDAFNVTVSNLTPAIAEVITVTAPAGIRFTAGTTVNFVSGALNTVNNGLAAPALQSMSADSTVLNVLPAPGAAGRLEITGVASIGTPTLTTTARSDDSVFVPVLSSVAAVYSNAAPGNNQRITLTMPANFKFRPTSAFDRTTDTARFFVVSRSADSNSVVIFPSPGAAAPTRITAVKFAPLASLSLTLPTTASFNFPLPNMGADDFFGGGGAAALGQMAAPTVVNDVAVYFDTNGYLGPDNVGDGGISKEMDYIITFAAAGTYTIKMKFTGAATDLDIFLSTMAGPSGNLGFSFLGNGAEESITFTATAGQTAILSNNWFAGPAVRYSRYVITRTS